MRVCGRCKAHSKKTKRRCKLRSCISLPYCHVHVGQETGLRVKQSLIPNAGKGLFAAKQYKRADTVAYYTGEILTQAQMDARYGKGLAQYALQLAGNHYIDAVRTDSGVARYADTCDAPRGKKNPCKNNVRFVHDRHKKAIKLQACTTIEPGSEIGVSYGDDYMLNGRKLVRESYYCRAAVDRPVRASGKSGESRARRAKRLAREAAAAALPPPPPPAKKKAAAKKKAKKRSR